MVDASVLGVGDNVVGWDLETTYAQLPDVFFTPATPVKVRDPKLSILNHALAEELGLNLRAISQEAAAALFAGQELPADSRPIAQAYAGHQFGVFTMLGDGRAILLGEHCTPSGRLVDVQLKGAGRTTFSRGGDGLASLGPMLREYIISEAMAALGIPTTRSLAVATTGEPVYRQAVQKGAVLTRVAASHIRVGTFEYLAARRDTDNLRLLADYAIERHYPELRETPGLKYLEFFRAVLHRQASLIARWQLVGFIHGVMNTDNMAISGETIDYGPCAFMNAYDPSTVFSSIDRDGRYAYGNQPAIAQWNLARLAEALLPLIDPDQETAVALATEALSDYPAIFEKHWLEGMRAKLGLQQAGDGDLELARSLLDWMHKRRADFTNTFLELSSENLLARKYQDPDFIAWHSRWRVRIARETGPSFTTDVMMKNANPALIPRNHRVEEAISAAEDGDDWAVLERFMAALANPYSPFGDISFYQEPQSEEGNYRTFCGT